MENTAILFYSILPIDSVEGPNCVESFALVEYNIITRKCQKSINFRKWCVKWRYFSDLFERFFRKYG